MRLIARTLVLGLTLAAVLVASPAGAQSRRNRQSNGATGENWHVEFSFGTWSPPPVLTVSTVGGLLAGSSVSAPTDLGMPKKLIEQFSLVIRPGIKHKFRIDYDPASYASSVAVARPLVFGGQVFATGTTVATAVDWKTWRFAYEYDFFYRPRVFAGLIVDMRHDDASVALSSSTLAAATHAKSTFPGIGGIFRIYPLSDVSLTMQFTGMSLPVRWRPLTGYNGHVTDFDTYVTLNFSDNFAIRSGYRSLRVYFAWDTGQDDLTRRGPYVMGVVRF
jgi:hypothetical protein